MSILSLTKEELTSLWLDGLLSDSAYFILALKYLYQNEWKDRSFSAIILDTADLEVIAIKFQGTKNERVKTIALKTMLESLSKLAKISGDEIEIQQLTILGMENFIGSRSRLESLIS